MIAACFPVFCPGYHSPGIVDVGDVQPSTVHLGDLLQYPAGAAAGNEYACARWYQRQQYYLRLYLPLPENTARQLVVERGHYVVVALQVLSCCVFKSRYFNMFVVMCTRSVADYGCNFVICW